MSLGRGDAEFAFDLPDIKRLSARKKTVMGSTVKLACCMTVWMLCMPIRLVYGGLEKECNFGHDSASIEEGARCGKQLSGLLSLVCYPHGYYSVYSERRKRHGMAVDIKAPDVKVNLPSKIRVTRASALAYLKKKRHDLWNNGNFKGIICECCYNYCSPEELAQYCNAASVLGT